MASNGFALKSHVLGILALTVALCALIWLGSPQIAQAATTTATTHDSFLALGVTSEPSETDGAAERNDVAPAAVVTSAQALADALNVDTSVEEPNAEVSEDGSTVTLLGPVELVGNVLEISIPEGQELTLDLASYNLTLQNGGTDAAAQLVVSGAGTFTITGSGGAVVSQTANGTIPAISVTGGELTLQTPLTFDTPINWKGQDRVGGVEVNGGTLTLPEGAAISGDGANGAALVMVNDGVLNLTGGTLTSANANMACLFMDGGTATLSAGEVTSPDENGGFAVVVFNEATASITGAAINGAVECDQGGAIAISGGSVSGFLWDSGDGAITVMPASEGATPAWFGKPVGLTKLDESVKAVEFEYMGTEPIGNYYYFTDLAAAEADAADWPDANVAPVSEQGYLCGLCFADDAEMANDFYNYYLTLVDLDLPPMNFEGPAVIGLGIIQPNMSTTFMLRDAAGEILYSEEIPALPDDTGSIYAQYYFDADLPNTPNPKNPEIGTGDYTFSIGTNDDPDNVFTYAPFAVSQVTRDLNGGTLPEGKPSVSWEMQGSWAMSTLPTRPGYVLSGWASTPVADMVTWEDEYGWVYTLPKEADEFTFTAQWEPDVVAVSRLWNPYNGAHLLTTDTNEVSTLESAGWKDEGTVFSEYGSAYPESTPVTRVYNPYNGDHLYSTGQTEVDSLVHLGWIDEGVKFYGSPDDAYPVYRLWNSYQTADGGLGSHLWTADHNEYVTLPLLPPVGAWQQENAVWYAASVPNQQ